MSDETTASTTEAQTSETQTSETQNSKPQNWWDYCPNCSSRLYNQGCKYRCPNCHYFMSCSDFD